MIKYEYANLFHIFFILFIFDIIVAIRYNNVILFKEFDLKTKQTTIIIPEELLKAFRMYAKSLAKPMTALIREFMEKEVGKYNKLIKEQAK